jgi:hypothetical protein
MSSAIRAVLLEQATLRRDDYEGLWRGAELSRAVQVSVPSRSAASSFSGVVSVVGRMAGALVYGVELAFGTCVLAGVVFVLCFWWPGPRQTTPSRKRER